MIVKSLEVYYDIDAIPGLSDNSAFSTEALTFRNAAMEHIELAIEAAGVGEWAGAEIGSGEVNFGFTVGEFKAAEQVVRDAVAGTPYEGIREIERREVDTAEFDDHPQPAVPMKFRFFQIIIPVIALPLIAVFAVINGLRRLLRR